MNAIITGATKGIGRAIANLLASKEINLCVCSRNKEDLIKMRAELLDQHPQIQVYVKVTDMSDKEQVFQFAEYALEHLKSIDILVNNAGIFIPGAVHTESEGALESMIETNLYSAYHLTRKLLPKMMAQGSGQIFNMCSVASKIAYPNGGSYSISKFALLGFSKVLREELKDKGIKVTSILPGATWSDSWKGVDLPKSRLMEANDIAKLIWGALQLSSSAVIEDIIIRPQLGDL